MNIMEPVKAVVNLGELLAAISALADRVIQGPAQAYTERQTLYVTIVNGTLRGHYQLDSPSESPRRTWPELSKAMLEAVTDYAEVIPRPRQIVWRTYPEVTQDARGMSCYLRLAVEPLEAESAPPPPAPISLAEARAVKANDSQLWSPADALRHALRQIENGEINPTSLMIDWFEGEPDGGFRHCYTLSGLTVQGRIAMLQAALTRAVNEWFR